MRHAHLSLVSAMTLAFAWVMPLTSPAHAAVLTNGDFEDTTGWGASGTTSFPPGWDDAILGRKNAADQQTGVNAIGGSGTSAFMPSFPSDDNATRRELRQSFDETSPTWGISWDFASEDPGGAGNRSMSGSIGYGTGEIIFRVVDTDADGDGDFQVFQGGGPGWQDIAALKDSVIFDPDVQLLPLTHSILISGDFTSASAAGRTYDVTITDSAGGVKSATGLAFYNGTLPVQNSGVIDIAFNTFIGPGDYVIDNVVIVPTPAALPAGLALLAAAGLRRRRV